jgi:hypothetical protein
MVGWRQTLYVSATRGVDPTTPPTVTGTQIADFIPAIYGTPGGGSHARPPIWDPRLDDLNVSYHPAADCSEGCWRLVRAEYLDKGQSGGLHHIFAKSLDANGQQIGGTTWGVGWPDGADISTTKPPPDWGDLAMWDCYFPDQGQVGGYRAWMGATENRSDIVRGMALPYCHHVVFRLTWQWDEGTHLTLFPIVFSGQTAAPVPSATLPPNTTATPTRTRTPVPTATSTPGSSTYNGQIIQTFPNCGLTQIFGVVHDQNGTPQIGVRLRLTWDGNNNPLYTTSGNYVRPETDASGWDFVVAQHAMDNWWRVAVVDAAGNPLSAEVQVHTVSTCAPTDLNVAKVRFRRN